MPRAATSPSSESGRRWVAALRVLLSAAILTVLFWQLDASDVLGRLGSIRPEAVGAGIALLLAGQWLNALRWSWLLQPLVDRVLTTSSLLRLVMIGAFFSIFLPTTVGGDVVRAEMSRKLVGGRVSAYTTILASRLMGLVATLFIGGLALILATAMYSFGETAIYLALLSGAVLLGTVVFSMSSRPFFSRARAWLLRPLRHFSPELDRVVTTLGASRRLLGSVFAISVMIIAVSMIGTVSVLAEGLGIGAPMYIHWIAVPVAMVVTLLPVSFNGAGVREVVFVVVYARVGVDPVSATALGLAFTALLTVVGLVGGAVFLLTRGEQ